VTTGSEAPVIYLDASFLFSLYFPDANSKNALRLAANATEQLLVSALCEIETINSLEQRVFRGEVSMQKVAIAIRDLEADLRTSILQWKPISEGAFERAKTLCRTVTPRFGLRTADLLHIATALEFGAACLFTFDQKQSVAAQSVGLKVNSLQ
jgi:predicted nucleic acid-binding protein